MKVWVLSSGEYSDWTIEGIFSSLDALAIGKEKLGNRNEWNDPEEYEIDEIIAHEIGPTWEASIECVSGKQFNVSAKRTHLRHPARCNVETWDLLQCRPGPQRNWAIAVTSPISQEHAIKVAVEKRQEWLRNQAATPRRQSEVIAC